MEESINGTNTDDDDWQCQDTMKGTGWVPLMPVLLIILCIFWVYLLDFLGSTFTVLDSEKTIMAGNGKMTRIHLFCMC